MGMGLKRPKTMNDCGDEDQQQFTWPNPTKNNKQLSVKSHETDECGHGSCEAQNQEGKGQQQYTRPTNRQSSQWLAVSHQPARPGATEHGYSKESPQFWKPLPSDEYLRTYQTGKTWSVL
jgi:hypothetical protein